MSNPVDTKICRKCSHTFESKFLKDNHRCDGSSTAEEFLIALQELINIKIQYYYYYYYYLFKLSALR